MQKKNKMFTRPMWELWIIIGAVYLLGFNTASIFENVLGHDYDLGQVVEHWIGVLGGAPLLFGSIIAIYKLKMTKGKE